MIEVHPATADRFEDLAVILAPRNPDTQACWCLSYRIPGREFRTLAGPQHPRTIPAVDESPVWSVVCFVIRPGFRRRGLSRHLLDGAVEYARSRGAPALEAYPVDPDGRRISSALAYVGTIGLFEAAGFERIVPTTSHSGGLMRWLMRLPLTATRF